MKKKAIIMAGGVGSRFWPRSRERSPKQLLPILGTDTMIQLTVQRLQPLIAPEDIMIITNRLHGDQVRAQLPAIPPANIIEEPLGRNTAPCIALAAMILHKTDPDTVMVVLPADHLIADAARYQHAVSIGCDVAEHEKALVTMGILPTRPETGFGYIQVGESLPSPGWRHVRRAVRFAEKPDLETAQRFLASGDFLWNSGMFIWRTDTILDAIKTHMKDLDDALAPLEKIYGTPEYAPMLEDIYRKIRGISIDYGVMEKAKNVFVVEGDFGWNDVGSWDEVANLRPRDEGGNSIEGNVFASGVSNSLIVTDKKFVAAIDVQDMIVINTDDALLVCKRGSSQDVKKVSDYLKRKHLTDLL